jgi:CheY-like chemotaxis protein
VLCIEDNPSNLELIEQIFAGRPQIAVMTALQGALGLELAREHIPDLVLLDLDLPDMSGSEVLARLQADPATEDLPVVIVSADATESQSKRMLASGAHAYITKPLNVAELLNIVDHALLAPTASLGA